MKTKEQLMDETRTGEQWHVLKAILEVVLDIRDILSKPKSVKKNGTK